MTSTRETAIVPREPTDEMLRVSLATDLPASYREHLRHPLNGEKTAREVERAIAKERGRWASMLAAAPASDLEQVIRERDGLREALREIAALPDMSRNPVDDFDKGARAARLGAADIAKKALATLMEGEDG